jgi:hypothetical protein
MRTCEDRDVAYPSGVRGRRRWPWVLLAILVVFGGIFVVIDRIALAVVENQAASSLQSSQNLSTKPSVSIAGFPFLTQVLSNEFDDVTVSASDITVGAGRTLRVAHVSVHLEHVTTSNSYTQVRARTATADARIDFTDLSHTLGVTVSADGTDRVVGRPSVTIAGHTFSAQVSAAVHTSEKNGISFVDPKISAAGVTLPAAASTALAGVFGNAISLAGLPFHVHLIGATVQPDGVVLHLTGHDLSYSRSS